MPRHIRLKRYLIARWEDIEGKRGIAGLADKAGVKEETLHAWWRPKKDGNPPHEPQLRSLTPIAKALGVTRAQIVAAMDGDNEETALPQLAGRLDGFEELLIRVAEEQGIRDARTILTRATRRARATGRLPQRRVGDGARRRVT